MNIDRSCLYVFALAVVIGAAALSSCTKLPLIGEGEHAPAEVSDRNESPVTPRELITAKLINGRGESDTPPLTVGKLIELADRYLSCDCADSRFVKSWRRTSQGYLLTSNSEVVRPLEFVCAEHETTMHCYLTEIDRGAHVEALEQRFVPGAEFIRFIYENVVHCRPEKPCP
jgi:hypothetical protein